MAKSKSKIGWRNQPKYIKPTTEGSCPYCHKHVKALEAHVKVKHKREKLPRKRR